MKTAAAAALAVLAVAGSANAFMFSPKHQGFYLSGTVLLRSNKNGGTPCNLTVDGFTRGERAGIYSAGLSGNTACNNILAHGIPWKVEISDGGQPIIEKVRYIWGGRVYAAPLQAVTVDGAGNWTFVPSGHLQLSGTVQSIPPITIKP
jgi:hypothetical protein